MSNTKCLILNPSAANRFGQKLPVLFAEPGPSLCQAVRVVELELVDLVTALLQEEEVVVVVGSKTKQNCTPTHVGRALVAIARDTAMTPEIGASTSSTVSCLRQPERSASKRWLGGHRRR